METKTAPILDRTELVEKVNELKRRGLKIVFTNGCFDLIHAGHVFLFKEARKMGDILIVALNSDSSIRNLKGVSRPVFKESDRCQIIASIRYVDFVTVFSEPTPTELLEKLLPDVLVKGGDYDHDGIVGHELVEANGGVAVNVPYVTGQSTSEIIDGIIENIRVSSKTPR
ncbi:MAG: D-glycero-beta-D-manno-heptose 1-phosphate adenylyltransferase, partial [Thermoplasmata archaeon]|nr:D-glycero-beta-D-manno-heptose 1-phosphate adenylyltransferase [Thermoplasmata archaeon]